MADRNPGQTAKCTRLVAAERFPISGRRELGITFYFIDRKVREKGHGYNVCYIK
ncbi:hypothetical protein PENSUB_8530 [Penicillium subrubescens]|uniref:Uncharacterized protein n=1 Tax=Penicillium subrubescens TaxID=1316194 RepID=A0A1Q5TFY2_9EURO|nr:hypothetical protein PENSUB_8530 [Penicillium subrubescens]